MAGVTHFERRDRAGSKKVHPRCPFCNKEYRCTPKSIVNAGGPAPYIDGFNEHLLAHLLEIPNVDRTLSALRAVANFAPMVWGNC